MASHSHEDAVTERRLKPIYDNLDNGNYKVAMQSADKLLKKHRDLHCAKVLKALALLRLCRVQESEALAKSVVALKPTDEPTLQALSICFREMNKVELIVEIFTNAVKSQPSEEYYTHLFMALVRMEDFKRQQQTAMSLYKLVPKNPFYFWGVISAVMQALNSDNSLGKSMLLPLAERMVEKMIKEDKLEGESEISLYLMILDLLGKHEKALEVVESKLGKSLLQSEIPSREERRAELFFKMQKWEKSHQAYRELLIKSPDSWIYYTNYFTSGFKLQENGRKNPDVGSEGNASSHGDCDSSNKDSFPTKYDVSDMAAFVLERIETEEAKVRGGTGRPLRGPYLAQLELLLRLSAQGKLDECPHAGSVSDAVVHYFKLFSDKTCCFSDFTPYLYLVPEEERRSCHQRMEDSIELTQNNGEIVYATSVKQLQRHLTSLKISRFYGFQDDLCPDDKRKLASELIKRYNEGLSFGKELLETDLQYSDEYLLMALHLLNDVWQETGDESILWHCLVLLKLGYKHSQSSHHFKLLLMRFYCMAGVFTSVPGLYDGLDIKHMQQDTLGYNILKYAKSLGHLSSAAQFYNSTLRFFISGRREVTEYMIASYRFGTYQKIPEFLRFSKKIKHSLHFAHTAIEKKLLDILQDSEKEGKSFTQYVRSMEIDPSKGTADWDKVTDQRDLDVIVSWNPPNRQVTADDKEVSLRQENAWVRLRDYVLRLLAVSIDLQPRRAPQGPQEPQNNVEKKEEENKENYNAKEISKSLLESFEDHLKSCADDEETRKQFAIQGPPTPLTAEYLDGNMGSLMALGFHLVQETYQINEAVADESSQTIQDTFCENCERLKKTLQESLKRSKRGLLKEDGEKKLLDRKIVTELTLLTETAVYLIYLLGVACKNLSSLKNKLSKKNRKKKSAPKQLPECIATFQSVVEELSQTTEGLETVIRDLGTSAHSLDMNQLTLTYPREQDEEFIQKESQLWMTVSESYKESSQELLELLKSKKDVLTNLRL